MHFFTVADNLPSFPGSSSLFSYSSAYLMVGTPWIPHPNVVVLTTLNTVWSWSPRAILRRTNWLYRVDALRSNDVGYLNLLWSNVVILREYVMQFLVWAFILTHLKVNDTSEEIKLRCSNLLPIIIHISQACISEGFCCLLDMIRIGFYPSHNRITRSKHVQRNSVEENGQNEAHEMTGFSKNQLLALVQHRRILYQYAIQNHVVFLMVSRHYYANQVKFPPFTKQKIQT